MGVASSLVDAFFDFRGGLTLKRASEPFLEAERRQQQGDLGQAEDVLFQVILRIDAVLRQTVGQVHQGDPHRGRDLRLFHSCIEVCVELRPRHERQFFHLGGAQEWSSGHSDSP
jgi:hypothetical protein